jgi:hypothetical protein
MDLGFDQDEWRRASGANTRGAAPEWLDLRDRLTTSWCLRRALSASGTTSPVIGSFDRWSAQALVSPVIGLHPVNPTALGNRKPSDGIEASAAEAIITGGQG